MPNATNWNQELQELVDKEVISGYAVITVGAVLTAQAAPQCSKHRFEIAMLPGLHGCMACMESWHNGWLLDSPSSSDLDTPLDTTDVYKVYHYQSPLEKYHESVRVHMIPETHGT